MPVRSEKEDSNLSKVAEGFIKRTPLFDVETLQLPHRRLHRPLIAALDVDTSPVTLQLVYES